MNGDHQQKRTIDKLKRELGQAILAPLYDPDVIEVMVNSDSSLWIEKLDQEPERLGAVNPSAIRAVIGTVAASLGSVAGAFLGRQVGLALIALYGAIRGTAQPMLIGAFAIAFFNLHDAVLLSVFGSGGPGAIAGLVLGVLALVVMLGVYRNQAKAAQKN